MTAPSLAKQQGLSPESQPLNVWDPRCWVWGCGGPMGNGGHHGMLDHSRTLRIPRHRLPAGVEEMAEELGLGWWLDREYGTLGPVPDLGKIIHELEPRAAFQLSPPMQIYADAAPLPALCPTCGGDMQPYDDGEYTSRCEDCGWVRP